MIRFMRKVLIVWNPFLGKCVHQLIWCVSAISEKISGMRWSAQFLDDILNNSNLWGWLVVMGSVDVGRLFANGRCSRYALTLTQKKREDRVAKEALSTSFDKTQKTPFWLRWGKKNRHRKRFCLPRLFAWSEWWWPRDIVSGKYLKNPLPSGLLSRYGVKEKYQPLYQKLVLIMAQKEGFEPSRRLPQPTPLAGEPLRPLGYFCMTDTLWNSP